MYGRELRPSTVGDSFRSIEEARERDEISAERQAKRVEKKQREQHAVALAMEECSGIELPDQNVDVLILTTLLQIMKEHISEYVVGINITQVITDEGIVKADKIHITLTASDTGENVGNAVGYAYKNIDEDNPAKHYLNWIDVDPKFRGNGTGILLMCIYVLCSYLTGGEGVFRLEDMTDVRGDGKPLFYARWGYESEEDEYSSVTSKDLMSNIPHIIDYLNTKYPGLTDMITESKKKVRCIKERQQIERAGDENTQPEYPSSPLPTDPATFLKRGATLGGGKKRGAQNNTSRKHKVTKKSRRNRKGRKCGKCGKSRKNKKTTLRLRTMSIYK